MLRVLYVAVTLFALAGCSPSPADLLKEHLGETGRLLVVADLDPSSLHQQWFEDVELIEVIEKDGKSHLLVSFVGLEPSPTSNPKPIQVPLAIDRIVEVVIGDRVVYRRE